MLELRERFAKLGDDETILGYHGNEWGGATFFFELPAGEAGGDTSDDRPVVLHGSV